ncbi:hypothetical protein [Dermatobacter hominis]|uniref:hypothetical protein n=1 Tax=Dermatobacter hominis TaxID=2884263 RepID=UPI001D122DA3|nr:hypothetical protein [Dermatobacter hominis]UDY35852.1 hypothetical protein LH044_21355 [Dermatobacter hominis]
MEGDVQHRETAVPVPVAATEPPRRELSVAGQYLTRLLGLLTLLALGVLAVVSWRVNSDGASFTMTGMTMPMFLVGVCWLATYAVAVWMVRLEWSGTSLALVSAALAATALSLGQAVPPDSPDAPPYFGPDAGELAVELRFSLVCAGIVFVAWAVWATMPTARRNWPRPAIAVLGLGVLALIITAWALVPSYPTFVD